MYKVIQLISKKLYNKPCPLLWNTCSLDEPDENSIYTKIWKSWNFEGKGWR